VIQSAFVF